MELLGFFVISMAIITVFLVDFFQINQFLAPIVIYWNSVSGLNKKHRKSALLFSSRFLIVFLGRRRIPCIFLISVRRGV